MNIEIPPRQGLAPEAGLNFCEKVANCGHWLWGCVTHLLEIQPHGEARVRTVGADPHLSGPSHLSSIPGGIDPQGEQQPTPRFPNAPGGDVPHQATETDPPQRVTDQPNEPQGKRKRIPKETGITAELSKSVDWFDKGLNKYVDISLATMDNVIRFISNVDEKTRGVAKPHVALLLALLEKSKTVVSVRPSTHITTLILEDPKLAKEVRPKAPPLHGKTSIFGVVLSDPFFDKKKNKSTDSPELDPQTLYKYDNEEITNSHWEISEAFLEMYEKENMLKELKGAGGVDQQGDFIFFDASPLDGDSAIWPDGYQIVAEKVMVDGEVRYQMHWYNPMEENSNNKMCPLYVRGYNASVNNKQSEQEQLEFKPAVGDYDVFSLGVPDNLLIQFCLTFQKQISDKDPNAISTESLNFTAFAEAFNTWYDALDPETKSKLMPHGAESENKDFVQPIEIMLLFYLYNFTELEVDFEDYAALHRDLALHGINMPINPTYYGDDFPFSGEKFGIFPKDNTSDEKIKDNIEEAKAITQELRVAYKTDYSNFYQLKNAPGGKSTVDSAEEELKKFFKEVISQEQDLTPESIQEQVDKHCANIINVIKFTEELDAICQRDLELLADGKSLKIITAACLEETDFDASKKISDDHFRIKLEELKEHKDQKGKNDLLLQLAWRFFKFDAKNLELILERGSGKSDPLRTPTRPISKIVGSNTERKSDPLFTQEVEYPGISPYGQKVKFAEISGKKANQLKQSSHPLDDSGQPHSPPRISRNVPDSASNMGDLPFLPFGEDNFNSPPLQPRSPSLSPKIGNVPSPDTPGSKVEKSVPSSDSDDDDTQAKKD